MKHLIRLDSHENLIGINKSYESVNIINYITKKYHISMKDFSDYLGYTRQNLYRYINANYKHTELLPRQIQAKIIKAYGVDQMQSVYEIEHLQVIYDGTSDITKESRSFSAEVTDFFGYIDNHKTRLTDAIVLDEDRLESQKQQKAIESLTELLLNNTYAYNEELLLLLNQFNLNDHSLLQALKHTLEKKRISDDNGSFTDDKKVIKQKMKKSIEAKNQSIPINVDDFNGLPRFVYSQDFENVHEFNLAKVITEGNVKEVILSIFVNYDMHLSEVHVLVKKIIEKFGEEIKITYNVVNEVQRTNITATLFVI